MIISNKPYDDKQMRVATELPSSDVVISGNMLMGSVCAEPIITTSTQVSINKIEYCVLEPYPTDTNKIDHDRPMYDMCIIRLVHAEEFDKPRVVTPNLQHGLGVCDKILWCQRGVSMPRYALTPTHVILTTVNGEYLVSQLGFCNLQDKYKTQ